MAKSLLSKETRTIWSRRIKGFWEEYSHNKIGLLGLTFVVAYIAVALLAPFLTPYEPIQDRNLAGNFAMPEWVTILPQFKHVPKNLEPPVNWNVRVKPLTSVPEVSESIEVIQSGGDDILVSYTGDGTETIHSVNFTSAFMYPYDTPEKFKAELTWGATATDAQYMIELYMIDPAGNEYVFWVPTAMFSGANRTKLSTTILPLGLPSHILERLGITLKDNLAKLIFKERYGEYKLWFQISFRSALGKNGTCMVSIENAKLKVYGQVHGILGCDSVGRDIFSQLVYGARISLAVGLLSAALSTSIGLAVGVISGYSGGLVDESMMRMVDVLLCLPVLPLLLALMMVFKSTSVWWLVLLIAIFGWLGLSRMVRSRVLSLKEMPFIECARAAGASKFYIMFKHVVPNVLPVALAALILSVPVAILTEAAISFIGLGDPGTPTWGRMLHYAYQLGGFSKLSWWWILPPGLAITILTLSFVFIGHAVDEVVNPRLRRRR